MKASLGVTALIAMWLCAGCGWFDDKAKSDAHAHVASVEDQMQSRLEPDLEPGYEFLSMRCEPGPDSRFACREILAATNLDQAAENGSKAHTTRLQFFYAVKTDESGQVVRSRSTVYLPIPSLPESRRALPEEFQDLAK
jgi:hypothetical protein